MFFSKIKFKKLIFSQSLLSILGLIIIVVLFVPLVKNIRKKIFIDREIKQLENEIDSLNGKNSELSGLIEYLNSDEHIEEQARLNLNYKKEGEKLVVIKENESLENINRGEKDTLDSHYLIKGLSEEVLPKPKNSNPKNWFYYFFK